MADQLATPSDLASLLQVDYSSLTAAQQATMTLLLETATAIVQEACGGQRIVQVVNDTITIAGYTGGWLDLPQIPVTAVSSVTLDGQTLTVGTDCKVFGNRLWRRTGWQATYGWPWALEGIGSPWYNYAPPSLTWPYQEPSSVVVVCTHGYAAGVQELQLARTAVLSLTSTAYSNPSGATSVGIDDYHASYDVLAARMQLSPTMRKLLARRYGRRAALVRIG